MKVLIISKEGDAAGIAHRLSTEGHHVELFIEDDHYKDTLKGIVERPKSWRPMIADADLVMFDMVGFSQYAPMLKRLGKPVLCCNPVADVLELDRNRGMELFHKLGIHTPPSQEFKTVEEAAKLKWINETGYVVKADGNQNGRGNINNVHTIEHNNNIRNSLLGSKNPASRPVTTPLGSFDTITDAAKIHDMTVSGMAYRCKTNTKGCRYI